MPHEFVGYLAFPKDYYTTNQDFDEFLEANVFLPLLQKGYQITPHPKSPAQPIVWHLIRDEIQASLEYNPNDGGFCYTVDKRTNVETVRQDFLRLTHFIED